MPIFVVKSARRNLTHAESRHHHWKHDTGANFSGCAGEDGDTGFCITLAQNIAFNAQLAAYAHSLGLSWGQKNGGGDAAFTAAEINMVHADWALIEECNRYGGCPTYTTYINLGKAVLNAEYKQDDDREVLPGR